MNVSRDVREIVVRCPAGTETCFVRNVQTSSESHIASCPVDTRDCLPESWRCCVKLTADLHLIWECVELNLHPIRLILVKQTDSFTIEYYCFLESYTVPFGRLVQTFRTNRLPFVYIPGGRHFSNRRVSSLQVPETHDVCASSWWATDRQTDKTGYALGAAVAEG